MLNKRVRIKKRRTFNKKDWNEIFTRAITTMLVSMVTQALKKGVPLDCDVKGFDDRDFLLPGALMPKKKTRNPAYDRRGKGKTDGAD